MTACLTVWKACQNWAEWHCAVAVARVCRGRVPVYDVMAVQGRELAANSVFSSSIVNQLQLRIQDCAMFILESEHAMVLTTHAARASPT